ncbi:MAG TPA: response regulator [Elusimicrobiota bacterium]|nr:response regulator [Elusimicrobiota bacterium]
MAGKIIIVDDDDIAGDLSRALLKDAGFEVELLTESRLALNRIRQARPDIVVLDILMPGIDGLSLCRQIKNDPDLPGMKVAIVSAKSFSADRARAKESGADIFISKPYDVETFSAQIGSLLEPKERAPIPAHPEPLDDSPNPIFRVSIWGSRSRSETEQAPSRYGRNTPCVGVEAEDHMLLFDAGTGAAAAGRELESSARHKEIWIFLSHFHAAHIEGLAEFSPLAQAGGAVHLCAAPETGTGLAELVRPILETSARRGLKIQAKTDLYELRGERYEILPGVAMTPFYANHPGTTLGFILEAGGRKIAYCPDDEINGESVQALQDHDEKIARLYSDADLVIHDARYTREDYPQFEGNGHSNFLNTVDLAGKCRVKRLVLFHQDARYSDQELDEMGAEAAKRAQEKGYPTKIAVASEGLRVAV